MALPREPRKGEVVTAEWVKACLRWAKKKSAIKFLPPLYADEQPDASVVVRYSGPQEAVFRITAGTNPYTGTEQRDAPDGAWINLAGGRVVTLGLYEYNGSASVAAGSIVLARRAAATSQWVFSRSCSAPESSGGGDPVPSGFQDGTDQEFQDGTGFDY